VKNYYLAKTAERDLIDIYLTGLNEWGEAQADIYADKLHETFAMLGTQTHIGVVRNDPGQGLRSFPQGTHLIIYIIDEGRAGIVRVLDQRMKPENWL